MSKLRIGVIGCGKKDAAKGPLGYAMAYAHGDAYAAIEDCELVACADIVEDNARAYADHFGFSDTYLDYQEMLAKAELDVVSICTWMHLHEPMVTAAVSAGVKAIHCEKPMSDTWAGSLRMANLAREQGVQLTFNHQRRYGEPFRKAKELLDAGEIGPLQRFESEMGNLYDTGTHFIDMMSFFLGDGVRAKWILAQIDYRTENLVFGAHCENQQLVMFEYQNGVFGFVYSGCGENQPLGVTNRLIGETGVIDVGFAPGAEGALRWRRQGETDWRIPDLGGATIHRPNFIERAIADVIECFRTGRTCQLNAANALIATEIIFGAYESSRRRGRVDFPLPDDLGSPLREMVAAGDLRPAGR